MNLIVMAGGTILDFHLLLAIIRDILSNIWYQSQVSLVWLYLNICCLKRIKFYMIREIYLHIRWVFLI